MTSEMTFSPILADIFVPVEMVFAAIVWAVAILVPVFVIHLIFTAPMRRAERARLFLDLTEDVLKRAQSIEEMIISLAARRDRTLGLRFHLLAAYLESGLHLPDALRKVPHFLPPQISEMLRTGEKLGDLRKVLPACREILRDRPAGVRSAVHYLVLVVLIFSPGFITVVVLMDIFIIPKFRGVAAGMGMQLWPETQFVFGNTGLFVCLELVIFFSLLAAVLAYAGGPGWVRHFQFRGFPLVDWLAWRAPWKQKRLQRTFSAMLAVLLDSGVPEAEAVRLAGDCTANEICRNRAERIVAALQQGVKLDDAVRQFDDSGEFHWRLANAACARGGFLKALRGWHQTLDAKAFQQEEATAHVVTSGLVILNGALVAIIATAVFGIFVDLLDTMLQK